MTDYESVFSYFYNMINASLKNVTTKKDMNQNLYNILSNPLYQNYFKNSKNIMMKNAMANNNNLLQTIAAKEPDPFPIRRDNPGQSNQNGQSNGFNRSTLMEILQQNQIQLDKVKNSRPNLDQAIKSQNLNKVLNKIHSIKTNTDSNNNSNNNNNNNINNNNMSKNINSIHQHQVNGITNNVRRNQDQYMSSRNIPNISPLNDLNNDEPNTEVPNKKTVRQLLEERQSYIKKLKHNQLELINCQLKINNSLKARDKAQIPPVPNLLDPPRNNAPRQQIPEMIDIEIIKEKNIAPHKLSVLSPGNFKPIKPRPPQQAVDQVYFTVPGYNEMPPLSPVYYEGQSKSTKSLTVRQLLDKKRNSTILKKNGQESKRRNRHVTFHPYMQYKKILPKTTPDIKNEPVHEPVTFLNGLGLNPNNPIILSDEELEVSSVKSYDSSIIIENCNSKEYSAQPPEGYDTYSEHNYILDPDLPNKAIQVVMDLNQELNSKKDIPKDNYQEMDGISTNKQDSSFNDLNGNHELLEQKDFAKNLNLIKSRDLKRTPIAYLNAKYPANEISRAIYAGAETKNAVLDFPKSYEPGVNSKTLDNSWKKKMIGYKKQKLSSNQSWTQVLEKLDFSSPLSQKIIKIFPEYHSKRLKRKALKVKLILN